MGLTSGLPYFDVKDADRALALIHGGHHRAALSALWALDETLGSIVARTTEPLIGQMRLTWWHDRLSALGSEPASDGTLLWALADVVGRYDVTGSALASLIEGWEALLEPLPLGSDALAKHGAARGKKLFALSAQLYGQDVVGEEGTRWALVDFARRCSDETTAMRALAIARATRLSLVQLPKSLRILARLADARLANPTVNQPLSRLAQFRAVFG